MTEIADCMEKTGLLENANALNRGKFTRNQIGISMNKIRLWMQEILL